MSEGKTTLQDIVEQPIPFFKRQEAKLGLPVLVLIGLALVAGGYSIGLWNLLLTASWTLTKAVVAAAGALATITILTSPKTWALFQIICYKIYNTCIDTIDPKDRAEFAIMKQDQMITEAGNQHSVVTAAVMSAKASIADTKEALRRCLATIETCKDQKDRDEQLALELAAQQLPLLEKDLAEYQAQYETFRLADEWLADLLKELRAGQQMNRFRLQRIIKKRKDAKGASGAAKIIMTIIGENQWRVMGDKAELQMCDEINRDLGYFQNMMRATEGMRADSAIQQRVNTQQALERVRQIRAEKPLELEGGRQGIEISLPQRSAVPVQSAKNEGFRGFNEID